MREHLLDLNTADLVIIYIGAGLLLLGAVGAVIRYESWLGVPVAVSGGFLIVAVIAWNLLTLLNATGWLILAAVVLVCAGWALLVKRTGR